MKFSVLALDYDGTVARDGVLDSDVKAAIVEARTRGIVVIFVTGRILTDLKRVAGNLEFVDAVVTENGAVLSFPNGQTRIIGHRPPQAFLDQLSRRGIQFQAGECIIESDAAVAPQILAIIRELELPLVLLFNRSRLMVLPQACICRPDFDSSSVRFDTSPPASELRKAFNAGPCTTSAIVTLFGLPMPSK